MQKSVQARKNRIISAMSGQFQSGLPIFRTSRNTNQDLTLNEEEQTWQRKKKDLKLHSETEVGLKMKEFVKLAKPAA